MKILEESAADDLKLLFSLTPGSGKTFENTPIWKNMKIIIKDVEYVAKLTLNG